MSVLDNIEKSYCVFETRIIRDFFFQRLKHTVFPYICIQNRRVVALCWHLSYVNPSMKKGHFLHFAHLNESLKCTCNISSLVDLCNFNAMVLN